MDPIIPSGKVVKKRRNIPLTYLQKRALKIMVENPKMSKHDALRQAGYSESKARNPYTLMRSTAFRQEMERCGLTEELIASSLVEDIKAKRRRRVEELKLGAQILHMTGTSVGTAIQINLNEDREKYA